MNIGLEGQVALVTGASKGIGAAIAVALGGVGCRVAVHYNQSAVQAEQVSERIRSLGGEAHAYQADLTSHMACQGLYEDVLEQNGRIDVLVNNAGDLVKRMPLTEYSLDDFDYLLRLNLSSVFQMCRLVGHHMEIRGSGSIINVSSSAARSGGLPGSVPYAATKAAVSTLTRGLARELAPSGVRVNTLAPGFIDTEFHDRHGSGQPLSEISSGTPMGRVGSPNECAGAALFLASSSWSSYVTGQSIEVNGGTEMP